jgi:RIO kinase 1
MQNKIQDIDWALNKLKNSTRDREGRKTVDDVFDESTLRNIQRLFNRGILSTVENIIATGKEANLFRAKTFDGRNRAVKIYRLNTATFRKLNRYIEGDPRFKNTGNSHRDRVFTWAQKEYKNLYAMKTAGAEVPRPFHVYKNIVVMQYLGWRYRPYPPVRELPPLNPKNFLNMLITSIKAYRSRNLSHGDLSEYNILNVREKPYIIDVGQAVKKGHPMYDELHERDMVNMYRYWKKLVSGLEKEVFD